MNKREVMLSLVNEGISPPYIPAAFFLHFDSKFHRGQAAINKHLEYFHYTDMDFVKIQYENSFPLQPDITRPQDWNKMPCYGYEFYEDQINIAKELVEAAGKDALILMTLYSPFMCAGHSVGKDKFSKHLKENPDLTKIGIEIITDSLMTFVKGCIAVGIDGFYHSTQGGESSRFEGSPIFDQYIKPYDLVLMKEIEQNCEFSILHICDYEGDYTDLSPFVTYPGQIVNSSLQLGESKISAKEVSRMFERPFMGGFDRHGIIVTGTQAEIKNEAKSVCETSPDNFVLGADCTVPSDIAWDNIKTAISTAHQYHNK